MTLISCGSDGIPPLNRGVDGTPYNSPPKISGYALPYKYYVTWADYNKYMANYKSIESLYDGAAGKNAIDIIPVDILPNTLDNSEFNISIVNTNLLSTCSGSAGCYSPINKGLYFDETAHRSGDIYLKENFSKAIDFEYTLMHEIGHSLGLGHIKDEISYMNPINTGTHYGFINQDRERVANLFEISEFAKDLELMGSMEETKTKENIKNQLTDQFGLSLERSRELSSLIFSFNKVRTKRALNIKEKNILTKKLIGINFDVGKKALEAHIQGNPDSLERIIERASQMNDISPEHMNELIEEYLL